MKALSTRNDAPQEASRPFDLGRDGFVAAEGAGVMVLESLESARARGAQIYAEVTGYGQSSDAFHMTLPHPEGRGAVQCMHAALADAGVGPQDIDYVNAHGTSTSAGDIAESVAIETVFREHAQRLMVSSTKSMTGHMLGAAGAVEAAFVRSVSAIRVAPPTINLVDPDPVPLDYVAGQARPARIRRTLSNSFGFGGTNVSLILSEYDAGET